MNFVSIEACATHLLSGTGLVRGTYGVWSFCFSRGDMIIFSAKCQLDSTTEADWAVLGEMAARIGIPKTVTHPETIETNPMATHYWMWRPE